MGLNINHYQSIIFSNALSMPSTTKYHLVLHCLLYESKSTAQKREWKKDKKSTILLCPQGTNGFNIWSRWGPQKFFPRFCQRSEAKSCKQSKPILARVQDPPWGPGSSSIFNFQICILALFLVLFLQIIGCTFVWVNHKKFNMKDSEHFGKYNFPFLCLRQSRVLFVHFLLFADTLLCT